MQYIFDGEVHRIAKIAGPKHNMLALGLTNHGVSKNIEIVDLKQKDEKIINIAPDEVKKQVILGIDEINKELGTHYVVTKIYFVSSDTPSKTVYTELSKEIIMRFLNSMQN